MKLLLSSLTALALALPAAAQCSDLTVTGDGAPGTTLTFDVTGSAADAVTIIFVGENAGSTAISLGALGTLDLGLDLPFAPIAFGLADANGDLSIALDVPNTTFPQVSLNGQAASVDFSIGGGRPSVTFCTSDVEGFTVGDAGS